MFRRRCNGTRHRWSHWELHNRYGSYRDQVKSRTCRCGAVQRFVPHTGQTTIWTPDGLESGLLDRGLTRQIFEDL